VPIIFEKTAKQLAGEKAIYMLITLVVGTAFGSIFFLADEGRLVWPVVTAIVVAILIAMFIFFKLATDTIAILKDGRAWKVEITEDQLFWFSPTPEQMKSFEAKLSDISSVQQRLVRYKNSKKTPRNFFHIHFSNGRSLELKPQLCGINPQKVFKALESRGVQFEFSQERQGSKFAVETA